MPLAALITHAKFDVAQHISLGHYTHEKNPVACAAGLAVLDVIDEEGLLERSRSLGATALERLKRLAAELPFIAEVRGVGLLLGIELCDSGERSAVDMAEAALYRCLTAGLSFKIGQGNVLVLAPPLNILEDELWWALDCIEAALRAEMHDL